MKAASPPPFFPTQHVSPEGSSGETCVSITFCFQRVKAFRTSFPFPFSPVRFLPFPRPFSSPFGPYSPFLLDLVQLSSRRVNPFDINEVEPKKAVFGSCGSSPCARS